MTNTVIDVNGLASALEQRVKADGISWRQAAGQIGVSPSLLTRVRNDQRPDLDAYARIVRWLRISADAFMIDPEELASREEPELGSSINALLRARSDLDEQDKEHLTNILSQGLVYFQQTRKPS
ncbi:helix-turn-helix transcriptional regulator [uncultured Microbacterium sp.]|uniref:helix-turn-helix transcriptional regulator n=1 Tax=uncultured Microbacterium sp. TaxID=191216 RepID=UPI0028E7AE44|nr:helix-turn-helix transcriptional regulator [uncultured Microbacterium sp.]